MVFAMLAMQELCVRVNTKRDSTVSSIAQTRSFLGMLLLPRLLPALLYLDFDPRYFWRWSRFIDYIQCVIS